MAAPARAKSPKSRHEMAAQLKDERAHLADDEKELGRLMRRLIRFTLAAALVFIADILRARSWHANFDGHTGLGMAVAS